MSTPLFELLSCGWHQLSLAGKAASTRDSAQCVTRQRLSFNIASELSATYSNKVQTNCSEQTAFSHRIIRFACSLAGASAECILSEHCAADCGGASPLHGIFSTKVGCEAETPSLPLIQHA
eukprot:4822687-Amphidinium_carterae.1